MFRHLHVFRGSGRRGVLWVLVHVGHHNRLRKRGAHVKTRTLLPVTTRADLEVERTVDAILDDVGKKRESVRVYGQTVVGFGKYANTHLLRAVDGREVLRHFAGVTCGAGVV